MSKHSTTIRKDCILRHWTTKYTERLRLHSYYFSLSLDELFAASTHGFHQYLANKIGTRQYNINLASKKTIEHIPADCIPAIKNEKKEYNIKYSSRQTIYNIPADCIPAIKNGNTFCTSISHVIPQYTKPLPKTFLQFILQQPS